VVLTPLLGLGLMSAGLVVSNRSNARKSQACNLANMPKWSLNICPILPVLPQIQICYLLSYWTYLLASIPLPVYNLVCFTTILLFYAFYVGYASLDLGLGLTLRGHGLGLTVLWSHWRPCSPASCYGLFSLQLVVPCIFRSIPSVIQEWKDVCHVSDVTCRSITLEGQRSKSGLHLAVHKQDPKTGYNSTR